MSCPKGNGAGSNTIAVGDRDGKVILSFPEPVSWVSLDPETSRSVAEAIARSAYKAHYGFAIQPTAGSMVSENVRNRLVTRLMLVLRTHMEEGKSVEYMARNVVDVVLSEVA